MNWSSHYYLGLKYLLAPCLSSVSFLESRFICGSWDSEYFTQVILNEQRSQITWFTDYGATFDFTCKENHKNEERNCPFMKLNELKQQKSHSFNSEYFTLFFLNNHLVYIKMNSYCFNDYSLVVPVV